jgi:phage tail-like protein
MTNADYSGPFYLELVIIGEHAVFQDAMGLTTGSGEETVITGPGSKSSHLPGPEPQPNLVLYKGIIKSESPLLKWFEACTDLGLNSKINPKNVKLNLLDVNGMACCSWIFHNAYPVKYSVVNLNNANKEIAVSSIEFAYTNWARVTKD